jgi:rod shape-determining protein MreD
MIYYFGFPFFLLFLIVLQNIVSDILFFGIVEVELSMILVLYAGFHLDVIRGGLLSIVAGFLLDCASGSVSGLHTVTYLSLFLVSMAASTRLSLDKPSLVMVFTLIMALFKNMIITVLYALIYGVDPSINMLRFYIPQILIVVLISPLFFHIFSSIETWSQGKYAKQFKRA